MFGRDTRLPRVVSGLFCPSDAHIAHWRSKSWVGGHTRRLLDRIESESSERVTTKTVEESDHSWLLRYRADLRRAIDEPEFASIMLFLSECPRHMAPVGVWLLGKCADRFRLHNLRCFCGDPSPKVRKHVARALRRLEAWHLLDAMAKAFPLDAEVQRTRYIAANPVTHRSFTERLKAFSKYVDQSHAVEAVGPSRMPYWSLYNPWQGRPPKSVWLIRQILWRIRQWVRGS